MLCMRNETEEPRQPPDKLSSLFNKPGVFPKNMINMVSSADSHGHIADDTMLNRNKLALKEWFFATTDG